MTTDLGAKAGRAAPGHAVPGWRRVGEPAAVAGAGLAWAGALRLRDPHVAGSWGTCPFLALTGLPCPVCGGLRAVNDLTRGDVVAAAGSNLVVVLGLAVAVGWWLAWLRRSVRAPGAPGTPSGPGLAALPVPAPRVAWAAFAAVLVFGALRWLPSAAWLAP